MKKLFLTLSVAFAAPMLIGLSCGEEEPFSPSGREPDADFTFSPTEGPAPLTVTFTDQSSNDPNAWQWDFGDNVLTYAQNPSHTYTQAGCYTVSLTAHNLIGYDTETKTDCITVRGSQIEADFSFDPAVGRAPLTVSFTDLSVPEPEFWTWDFGDGSDESSEPNPTHVYTEPGVYTVSLTASTTTTTDTETKSGCITATTLVVVLPWYSIYAYTQTTIITEDPPDTTVTYGEGSTMSNWEPMYGEMRDTAIIFSWDTVDMWDNPYVGSLSIILDTTSHTVAEFRIDATVLEGTPPWAYRQIHFAGKNLPLNVVTPSYVEYHAEGTGCAQYIDSLSQYRASYNGLLESIIYDYDAVEDSWLSIYIEPVE